MYKKCVRLTAIMAILFIVGCEVSVDEQGKKVYAADPNTVAKIEAGTEAGVTLAGALSLIWPALVPVAGIGAGVLGTWRKMKPQVMAKTTEAEAYYKAGEMLTTALEEIKTTQPATWAVVGPVIEKAFRPASAIEDTIRGFRGLPPKA